MLRLQGGISGTTTTATELATLVSDGMTLPVFVSIIGAEMLYLSRIQMRLVLDLAVVYDLQLDLSDPEDILMVFAYALGIAPAEFLGNTLAKVVAPTVTRDTIRQYISKSTLDAVQQFGRRIGLKILQRTIIKYAIPVVSAVIGTSYNYTTTKSIGSIAKRHLKRRDRVTDELRTMLPSQHTYDLIFPAAIMFMTKVDGRVSEEELLLYQSMISRMSLADHDAADFQRLLQLDEDALLAAIAEIEEREVQRSLLDALALIAVYDGDLADVERAFLERVGARLDLPLDFDQLNQRAKTYNRDEKGLRAKSSTVLKNTIERTNSAASGSARSIGRQFKKLSARFGRNATTDELSDPFEDE